jgi:hypothetical protein
LVQLVPRSVYSIGTWHPDWLIEFFLAPRNRLWTTPLQSSKAHCTPLLVEAGCSKRPFALLHRPAGFPVCRGRVDAPGLSLRCHDGFCPGPFGSELRSSPLFPESGSLNVQNPLPAPEPATLQPVSCDHSPSGLAPFRIKVPRRFRLLGLALAIGPISLRSPFAVLAY